MKPPRVWLIVTTVVFGCAGIVGVIGAIMSFFLFDAPGSEKLAALWILFWSLLTFPAICAGAIAASWIGYALQWFRFARLVSMLPLLNIAAGGAAFCWIAIFNGGRFT